MVGIGYTLGLSKEPDRGPWRLEWCMFEGLDLVKVVAAYSAAQYGFFRVSDFQEYYLMLKNSFQFINKYTKHEPFK